MLFACCSHAVVPSSASCQPELSHSLAQPRRLRCPLSSQAPLVRGGLASLGVFTCLYACSSTYLVPFPVSSPISARVQPAYPSREPVSALAPDIRPSSHQSEGRTLAAGQPFLEAPQEISVPSPWPGRCSSLCPAEGRLGPCVAWSARVVGGRFCQRSVRSPAV